MPFVFIFVLGFVVGFAAALVYQRVLKDAEAARKAKVTRKQAEE